MYRDLAFAHTCSVHTNAAAHATCASCGVSTCVPCTLYVDVAPTCVACARKHGRDTRKTRMMAVAAVLTLLSGGIAALWHARAQNQHEYELAYLAQRVHVEPCDKASLRQLLAAAKSDAELDEMQETLYRSSAMCPYERAVLFASLQRGDSGND